MTEQPKPARPEAPEDTRRSGPGTGAGRGNDLPSESETKKDTRTAEGDTKAGTSGPDAPGRD